MKFSIVIGLAFFVAVIVSGCGRAASLNVVLDSKWVSSLKPGEAKGLRIRRVPGKTSAKVAVQVGDYLIYDENLAMSQDNLYVDEIISTTGEVLCADGENSANCIISQKFTSFNRTKNECTIIFIKR